MYDFDSIIDRSRTDSYKLDLRQQVFGNPNVIPLWVADMDLAVAPPIAKVIQERARHELYGYTIRSTSFIQSIVNWQKKQFQWTIEPDWVAYSPGVVPALAFSILSMTDPQDGIIIQPPVYPPFFSVVKSNNRKLLLNPLIKNQKGEYVFNLEQFEQYAALPSTKLFILCHPHNPVGRDWSLQELTDIGNICIKHGVTVLSDEIHADLVLMGKKHTPFAAVNDDFAMNSITFMAPSKTFNIAGLNTSYVISKNRDFLTKYLNFQNSLQLNLGHVFGGIALQTAYNHCEGWLKELLFYLADNVNFVHSFLKTNIPEVTMTKPDATFLLWLDFSALNLGQDDLRQLLYHKAGVGLNDGLSFGQEGNGYMRMNVACPQAVLQEALTKIERALR